MYSTRQRILDYLSQHGYSSARQLATAFGMTQANLRHHLGLLLKDGRIRETSKQKDKGPGRPRRLFALSEQSEPNNLGKLASALLDDAAPVGQEERLRRYGKRLLGDPGQPSAHISQRLVAAVQNLTPMGYKPHWEARPQAPEIVFGHCPYAAIIDEHPELCSMDSYMLEELLGAPAEQTAKLQTGPHGVPICIFKVIQVSKK